MNREIKFRMYLPGINKLTYAHTIAELVKLYHPKDLSGDIVFEQYTGINDKNGTEIYEGDIISWSTRRYKSCYPGFPYEDRHQLVTLKWRSAVEWEEGAFCATESFDEIQKNNFCIGGGHEYEVIGNIHQNPELLKGGEHG